MTVNGQLAARSPADGLAERLDDPKVAAALGDILEHADLLALLVESLDGFVRRGDVITEAVADGVRDLRSVGLPVELADVDLRGLVGSLATLSGGVAGATPQLQTLLTSSLLTDPRTADTLVLFGEALVAGRERASAAPAPPSGVFGLLRTLRDDDVARGLAVLVETARALGRRLT